MLLTVAIPVYNAERYVRQAIQSVLDQTFTDFELIITDDGSTDGTLEIIQSFKDPRIIVIVDGMHKGLAIRLNEQIAMARGEYFVRMDADDAMLPQRLERQVVFFKEHPDTDVVGTTAIVIDENGKHIGWRGDSFGREEGPKQEEDYFKATSFMHPTVMGRTDWFRKYYYNPACEGCEDLDLWARSAAESVFFVLREPLLLYRDPQHLNLQTYLFRRKQERYALKLNRERWSFSVYHYFQLRSRWKSFAAWLLTLLGLEQWLLSYRNQNKSPLNKRLLHVITSLRTGGAEKLLVDLLPRLANHADVELLLFDGVETPFYHQLQERGIRIHRFGQECNVYNPLFILRLIPFLRRFDVVHAHNTACQMFVAMANLFVHTRIVTTEHSTSNRRRGHKLFFYLDRWMYRQFETIITVSDIAGQNIKDYVSDQRLPIQTIVNGIDVDKYRQAEPCPEIEQQFPNTFKSVMVAGFRYEKDQPTVVRSYSLLPENYHLFLVGDGEERGKIEILVDTLGLSNRVHFLGIRMDVPNLLQSADAVIMSSHREGLSLSNLEGMASGRPFIASDVDGLHEIVDGYGILFPHEDPQALADAIRRVSEDREYAKHVADRCVERAKMFDISVMAEKYSRLYL